MCTIGSSYYKRNGLSAATLFKQCDLMEETEFLPPKIAIDRHAYLPMRRKKNDGTTPAWAGINDAGVCFTAADSYLDPNGHMMMKSSATSNGMSVFDMYEQTIKQCGSAKEAAELAVNFYRNFPEPDIFMVGDLNSTYFIEAYQGQICCIERKNGFFASTNHFRMVYGGVPFEKNHSTYLRLNRAEQILSVTPDFDGVGRVLRDKYFGDTVWSICRTANPEAQHEDPYYTQASVIFHIESDNPEHPNIAVEYVINGNPETGEGYMWKPFDESAKPYKVANFGNSKDLPF